jgi:hypothetical protein
MIIYILTDIEISITLSIMNNEDKPIHESKHNSNGSYNSLWGYVTATMILEVVAQLALAENTSSQNERCLTEKAESISDSHTERDIEKIEVLNKNKCSWKDLCLRCIESCFPSGDSLACKNAIQKLTVQASG